jgi:periplasmic protein TonB
MKFPITPIAVALLLCTTTCIFSSAQVSDSANVNPPSNIITVVEIPPEPEGGMIKFYEFIGKNIQYPKLARKKGIEGKVFVGFVVEKDGTLSNVNVLKGIGGGCDEEALRVVSISPKWIPGSQKGKIVRVKMVLPISFAFGSPKQIRRDQRTQDDLN